MTEASLASLGVAGIALIGVLYQAGQNKIDRRIDALFKAYDADIQRTRERLDKVEADLLEEIERRKLAEIGLDVADIRVEDTQDALRKVRHELDCARIELAQEKSISGAKIAALEQRVVELEAEVAGFRTQS